MLALAVIGAAAATQLSVRFYRLDASHFDLAGDARSLWLGIPVSSVAGVLYSLIALLVPACHYLPWPWVRGLAWRGLLLVGMLVAAGGAWFIHLQITQLSVVCPDCLLATLPGPLLLMGIVWHGPLRFRLNPSSHPHPFKIRPPEMMALAVLAALGMLTLGINTDSSGGGNGTSNTAPGNAPGGTAPWLPATTSAPAVPPPPPSDPDVIPPPPLDIAAVAPGSISFTGAVPTTGPIPATATAPAPAVKIRDYLAGRLRLDPSLFPVEGDINAPHMFLAVLDYSTPASRELYQSLQQIREHYGQQIAFTLVLVPWDVDSNRLLKGPSARRDPDSCEYVKLALALWRVKPSAFFYFHSWLLRGPKPPPVAQARALAASLLGEPALAAALHGQTVREELDRNLAILEHCRDGQLPQLLFGSVRLTGRFPANADTFAVLEEKLGVRAPNP